MTPTDDIRTIAEAAGWHVSDHEDHLTIMFRPEDLDAWDTWDDYGVIIIAAYAAEWARTAMRWNTSSHNETVIAGDRSTLTIYWKSARHNGTAIGEAQARIAAIAARIREMQG